MEAALLLLTPLCFGKLGPPRLGGLGDYNQRASNQSSSLSDQVGREVYSRTPSYANTVQVSLAPNLEDVWNL